MYKYIHILKKYRNNIDFAVGVSALGPVSAVGMQRVSLIIFLISILRQGNMIYAFLLEMWQRFE